MRLENEVYDVVIIGAGPAGLACAIEAEKQNLSYRVIEKGCLVNSIFRFPTNLIFFSTPELLEMGGIPFVISGEKPTRTDVLNYYRRLTEHFRLKINFYEKVEEVSGEKDDFFIETNKEKSYRANNIIVATGQYDVPNLMDVPGEDLDKVNHYYYEGHPFYEKKVAVIGGKNSAVEAALDLYRHGADVTIVHRGEAFGESVKYWILPDIQNRIEEGKITARFNTVVEKIEQDSIILRNGNGTEKLENDFVFAMTGYIPNVEFLQKLGIEIAENITPIHDFETLESNISGMYIAGVITAGGRGSKVFIENLRDHGTKIMGHISNGRKQ